MDVFVERACGLDVHKRTVVACLIPPGPGGTLTKELRTFSTVTADLLRLAAWLRAAGCTPVAMESTGVYTPPTMLLTGRSRLISWLRSLVTVCNGT